MRLGTASIGLSHSLPARAQTATKCSPAHPVEHETGRESEVHAPSRECEPIGAPR